MLQQRHKGYLLWGADLTASSSLSHDLRFSVISGGLAISLAVSLDIYDWLDL